ncbi:hypothetical protein [Bacillus toyonensis]|uniref:hypothetical protein n=1 Tax=Bacillus toyonensis TaxID=155322 RepID=UPI00027BEA9F|nr:hypothetical protein [Bacillus toyonensis]EJV41767.1 hypothetical protein IEA_05652 [Bacillus toyonensis]
MKQCEGKIDSNNIMRSNFEMRKVELLNKIANAQFKALLNNEMRKYYRLRMKYEKVRAL